MLWYSLEAPWRGASNEHPRHMFSSRNKKVISIFRMKKAPYLLLWVTKVTGHFKFYQFLGKFGRQQIDDIFLIFFQKQLDLTFHANCFHLKQFAWIFKTCFLGKIWKPKDHRSCSSVETSGPRQGQTIYGWQNFESTESFCHYGQLICFK